MPYIVSEYAEPGKRGWATGGQPSWQPFFLTDSMVDARKLCPADFGIITEHTDEVAVEIMRRGYLTDDDLRKVWAA